MTLNWLEEIEGEHKAQLNAFYTQEHWTKDRTDEQIAKMLRNCDITIGCCNEQNQLIGFARVLTDYTFKAMIFDVIVKQNDRGKGIGNALINRIVKHPKLANVESFELYCPEHLIAYYNQLGFERGTVEILFLKHP